MFWRCEKFLKLLGIPQLHTCPVYSPGAAPFMLPLWSRVMGITIISQNFTRGYMCVCMCIYIYTQGCWWVLSLTRKETSYSDRRFWFSHILYIIIIGGILVLFTYITRLASNKLFSPSNKIHWEVGLAKDLSAPLYIYIYIWMLKIAGCLAI